MEVILEIKNIGRSYFADIYIKFYIYIYIYIKFSFDTYI